MKTIKFKIWDKKLNVMWEPIELPTLLRYLIFQNCPNATAYEALKDHFQDMVWLEFTGLKDRNGKEIYEGDIVTTKNNARYEVKFGEYLHRDNYNFHGEDSEHGNGWFLDGHRYNQKFGISGFDKLEVIGNIFQNPDLLKE